MADKSNLFRALTSVFLVNSAAFAKATPVEQTEALTQTEGKLVLFVDSFAALGNTRKLRDRILAGDDVSMELEFNGIELSASELATLSAVRPILERIGGLKGNYPWVEQSGKALANVKFVSDTTIQINGYNMTMNGAKFVFDRATKYWSGGPKPSEVSRSIAGRNRYVSVSKDSVNVGCQSCSRETVEAIGQQMGWEPVIFGDK